MVNGTDPSSPSQNAPEPTSLLRILVAVFSGVLFGWFFSKFCDPNRESTQSVNPQDTPAKETYNVPRVVAPNSPQTPSHEENPNGSADKTPTWKKWVEISIAVGTLGLLGINILLWRSTRKAADAANQSAKTARDALVSANRPWLGTEGNETLILNGISNGALLGNFSFSAKNFGPSPALSVGKAVYPFVRGHGDMSDFDEAKKRACEMADTDAFVEGSSVFPQQIYTYGTGIILNDFPKRWQRIVLEACLAYADQFNPSHTVHHTTFCIVGDAQSRVLQDSKTLGLCGYHEIAD